MENFKLHFAGVPEDDRDMPINIVKKEKDKWNQKIQGEYEKTKEESKAIDLINNFLQQEIKELNVEPKDSILPNRVHFIDGQIAKSLEIESDGVYSTRKDAVFINKDNFIDGRLNFYKNILHEIIHYYSFNSLIAIDSTKDIKNYRSGFVSHNPEDTSRHEHLRGFNEAVVEKVLQDILRKNRDFLIKELNITNKEIKSRENAVSYYTKESDLLNIIIDELAKFKNKNPDEIWKDIKKGLFTGNMMFLRDIEKVFGPGSLRVLAVMDSKGSNKNDSEERLFNNLDEFFKTKNQKQRDILAKQILSERERLRYNK